MHPKHFPHKTGFLSLGGDALFNLSRVAQDRPLGCVGFGSLGGDTQLSLSRVAQDRPDHVALYELRGGLADDVE